MYDTALQDALAQAEQTLGYAKLMQTMLMQDPGLGSVNLGSESVFRMYFRLYVFTGQLRLTVSVVQMLVKPAGNVVDWRTEVTGATEATIQVRRPLHQSLCHYLSASCGYSCGYQPSLYMFVMLFDTRACDVCTALAFSKQGQE